MREEGEEEEREGQGEGQGERRVDSGLHDGELFVMQCVLSRLIEFMDECCGKRW